MIVPVVIPAQNSDSYSIDDGIKFILSASVEQLHKLSLDELGILEQSIKKQDKANPLSRIEKRLVNQFIHHYRISKRQNVIKQSLQAKQKKKTILLWINFCIMLILNLFYYLGLSMCFGNEKVTLNYIFVQGSIRQIKSSELHLPQWYFLSIYIALYIAHSYYGYWKWLQSSIESEKSSNKLQLIIKKWQIYEEERNNVFDNEYQAVQQQAAQQQVVS